MVNGEILRSASRKNAFSPSSDIRVGAHERRFAGPGHGRQAEVFANTITPHIGGTRRITEAADRRQSS
jgi:hypothetical protein